MGQRRWRGRSSLVAVHVHLVRSGYDPTYGARPLKRAIQKQIETRLGRMIIGGLVGDGQEVTVDFDARKKELTFSVVPGRPG